MQSVALWTYCGENMEVQCDNVYCKQFGILTKSIITEPDGTKRDVCPLFYGQMIHKYKGKYFYVKDMPVDYFKKANLLEERGWGTWHHYDNWINLTEENNDYGGVRTDDAIRISNNLIDLTT